MKAFSNAISTIISLLVFSNLLMFEQVWGQSSRRGIFEHKKLGIHFLYDEDINSPDGVINPNTEKWQTLTIKNKGVTFSYPSDACIFSKKYYSHRKSSCNTTFSIFLGENNVVDFFITDKSFNYFADIFGFEKILPETNEKDSIWISLGRQGTKENASEMNGFVWKGLRGHNVIGLYGDKGYEGITDFIQVFLFRYGPSGCNAVFSFYSGPGDDLNGCFDKANCYYGETDFYEIVASFSFTD